MRLGKFIADKFPLFFLFPNFSIYKAQTATLHTCNLSKQGRLESWYTKSMNLGPFQKVFSFSLYVTKFALKTILKWYFYYIKIAFTAKKPYQILYPGVNLFFINGAAAKCYQISDISI